MPIMPPDSRTDRFWSEVKDGNLRTHAHERVWVLSKLRRVLGRAPTNAELFAVRFRFADEVTEADRDEGLRLRAAGFPGVRVWP